MTYVSTGVDYDAMDPFKVKCQKRAALTSRNALRHGISSNEWSRGESAFCFSLTGRYVLGHVEEGLGTKNLVADAMRQITGKTYYDQIAQDTVAMIVNDPATLGLSPVSIAMHLAVGDSKWFDDEQRTDDLIRGWGNSCDLAGCIWGGGETPTLKGIIYPEAAVLSGSAVCVAHPQAVFAPKFIHAGDLIVFLQSSGIHANGLTLARRIAKEHPHGYEALLSDGRMYGEALLDPTHIYCSFVESCQKALKVRYAVNITGHGWRKLMRAPQPFAYIIEKLPPPLPIFEFIQAHGPVSDVEAYGNLNMGAGFALIIDPKGWDDFVDLCTSRMIGGCPIAAYRAGYVEQSTVKKVVIQPKGIEFSSETLSVR